MAKILSKTGISTGDTVKSGHVTQSIDAFIGIDAYDIFLSGSFNMTGSINGAPTIINSLTASNSITSSYSTTSSHAQSGKGTFSGSFIGEVTNVYRPVLTASINPFTASDATAGAYYRAGGNVTCSIFITASVACTIGSEFEFFQTSSAGNVLFKTGSGVTLNSKSGKLKLVGQFSAATLKYVGSNKWDLIGDLS
tara:strand:+ start:588 stop:1172 length:585 start_codon:yes stop_codon:yes gene_type:complete